jgi:dipeptidyl aminopeptidase/acylaminoacyl peptidase
MFRACLCTSTVLLSAVLPLVSDSKVQLTIDNIMRGPNLVGTEPAQVRWSGDGSKIYFQWKRAADPIIAPLDTWVVNRDGIGLRKLSDEEARLAPPAPTGNGPVGGVETSEDGTLSVYSGAGDIFVFENATGKRRQVTKTSDAETNPRFLPGAEHRISFVRGDNLYIMSLDKGELEQITDIRSAVAAGAVAPVAAAGGRGGRGGGRGGAAGGEEPKGTDAQEYLKKEQREIFDVVREREKLKEETDSKQKKLNPRKPYTLQARQTMGQMQLSPDGKYVLAVISETANGSKNSVVPNWITDSSFPEDLPGRARVGDALGKRHLVVVNVETGEVRTVDHGEVGALAEQIEDGAGCNGGGGGRGGSAQAVSFSPDGGKAVFNARSEDNKTCWIFALDLPAAKAHAINTEHDEAWLGGPEGGQGWLADSRTYYFTSEHDGFNHLYEIPFEGGEPKQITSGRFEIDRATLSHDKSTFYLITSEGSPYERHLWTMPAGGGPRTRITKLPGGHAATLSPDEKWVADIYSYTNKPPELYVQPNGPMAAAKKLTESPAPEFASYPWSDPPIVEITTRDGVKLPGTLYKPAGYKKGGPAVVFVHGSGYAQNVDKWWSASYYREYLFNQFLTEHGYMVLAVDYRASKGYGRDWRTAIYRHMGGKDLDDQVDAAKWLVEQQGVDPKRIGIYGGSYGGFITLMAMFTQPDMFAAGAALRPVSDWANYNQNYSGNILNQPQKDGEAYKQSSPIYFASGLKGHLLICHGMVDTNVHFVDTVRLVEKLIELHKDNWELAVYPVEDHGFVQPASWADEYKRIFKLFETNLKN